MLGMRRRGVTLLGSLVIVFSLAWLTAAYADSGSGKDGKVNAEDNSKDKSKGTTGSQGTTGGQGTTGNQGTIGGQGTTGSDDSQKDKSKDVAAGVDSTEGKVFVRVPGTSKVQEVDASHPIPAGAHVDARRGKVTIITTVGSQGATQSATFWGGVFKIAEDSQGYTNIVMLGKPRGCAVGKRATASRRKPKRQLWGHDHHGKYRTHGQNSVATVRGTTWLTKETCRGTLTRVSEGSVSVRDLHGGHKVLVTAGHSHLAPAGRTH
jgi:hypothetical protein